LGRWWTCRISTSVHRDADRVIAMEMTRKKGVRVKTWWYRKSCGERVDADAAVRYDKGGIWYW